MKKYGIIALALLLALSMCACRFGRTNDTTGNTGNQQQTDITTAPTVIDPILPDPTIDTNIPDPDVDNDHMIDDTTGNQSGSDMNGDENTSGNDEGSDPLGRIRRRMR